MIYASSFMLNMSHPHFFTINLLKNLIATAPMTFPKSRQEDMLKRADDFLNNPESALSDIEQTIISYGREIWPYRESYQKMYELYGRQPEEEKLASFLSGDLKNKYLKFLDDRGNIEKLTPGAPSLENYFTSDEQAALVEAELKAHDAVHNTIEKLIIGEKQEEYYQLLEVYKNEERQIEEKLKELKAIGEHAPKWQTEIDEKVKAFEEGFGYLERPVALADVVGELEYYLGVVGLE